MINIKRIFVLFFILFVVICCLLFVMKREIVFGLNAGLAIGALNLAAITFTVKSLIKPGSSSAGAALLTVLVYLLKIAVIGCAIAAVIIYRQYFSIKGFLIGFTLTLVLIAAEALVPKMTKETK
jgi:Na+/melibiose symporter-like transporter